MFRQDVIGYQDLDAYGSWSNQPTYGNVWFPTRVEAGWAPYRDGHWAWVDPWGWTWVDDAPWGFAVSHYGRWSNFGGRWGWVPGPVRSQAYYAPALVAFVGGSNFQLSVSSGNVGGVAWFPLGPREVYRPWYTTSRRYFENVNASNTVVNTTVINNYYNNTNVTNVNYVNRQVPGAVVAVPTTAFVQSQQVARSAVRVTPQMAANAPVTQAFAVVPTERSVRGAAAQGEKPPARALERPVVARTAPAPTPPSFAAQQQELQARQGKPLEDAQRKEIKAARAAPAVNVVAQPNATPPRALLRRRPPRYPRAPPGRMNASARATRGSLRRRNAPRRRKLRNRLLRRSPSKTPRNATRASHAAANPKRRSRQLKPRRPHLLPRNRRSPGRRRPHPPSRLEWHNSVLVASNAGRSNKQRRRLLRKWRRQPAASGERSSAGEDATVAAATTSRAADPPS